MSLLTTAELLQHVESDLDTAALQRLIDDAEADIVERYGEHETQVDDLEGGTSLLFLKRRAASITSITDLTPEAAALDEDDFQLRMRGMAVARIAGGCIGFRAPIRVEYVPVSDTARRKRVIVDLVQLAIQHDGLASVRDGDHSHSAVANYALERERVLSALDVGTRSFA